MPMRAVMHGAMRSATANVNNERDKKKSLAGGGDAGDVAFSRG